MPKRLRCSQFIFVITVFLLAATAAWADNVVQVTSPAALGPDSSISWTQLGGDQTQVPANFSVVSSKGLSASVALGNPNSVVSVVCKTAPPFSKDCSWNGKGFTGDDSLLWTVNAWTGGNGPLSLSFSTGVIGAGALIQSDVPGQFTASIEAFSGATSLGKFTEQSDAEGKAVYLGVKDNSGANITSVVYSLTVCAGSCADFAVDAVDLATAATANFALSASPNTVAVTQSNSATSTITITPSNGFSGSVILSASGLPSGVTATFVPNPATTTSTLTLAANSTATAGTVTVTITGTSGTLTNTTTLKLTVNATGGGQVTASPSPMDFGNVHVNQRIKKTLTLLNTGKTKVTIGAVSLTVTSGNPNDFSFNRFCNEPLGAGKTCVIAVIFREDAVGMNAATLNIETDAPGSPLEVPLIANGIK